eukprot:2103446-Amphidinium_carterae.1
MLPHKLRRVVPHSGTCNMVDKLERPYNANKLSPQLGTCGKMVEAIVGTEDSAHSGVDSGVVDDRPLQAMWSRSYVAWNVSPLKCNAQSFSTILQVLSSFEAYSRARSKANLHHWFRNPNAAATS